MKIVQVMILHSRNSNFELDFDQELINNKFLKFSSLNRVWFFSLLAMRLKINVPRSRPKLVNPIYLSPSSTNLETNDSSITKECQNFQILLPLSGDIANNVGFFLSNLLFFCQLKKYFSSRANPNLHCSCCF